MGTLGALVGTINVLTLSNPMTFHISTFIDSVLGQAIGCFLALMVILLIRDTSKARIARTLLNRFMVSAISSLTTDPQRRKQNHLPALYQQLNMLLNLFPEDIDKYRVALLLIIAHQRLRSVNIPADPVLSDFHKQLRHTAGEIAYARSDSRRSYYFSQLLQQLDDYQKKLSEYRLSESVTEPVSRLVTMLGKYQNTLIQV
ncbi:MAG: p-hydroxybenzoic acid efflux pump subunit AaeB [Candidatus Erwinia impunctatus]|nr:p-hydroxybenzoic acid efflux pump subunit AaeB [Culicoides impunctatus]